MSYLAGLFARVRREPHVEFLQGTLKLAKIAKSGLAGLAAEKALVAAAEAARDSELKRAADFDRRAQAVIKECANSGG